MTPQPKKRILSGMRPTGRLHLGNYVGALENWVHLQGEYENFHEVADWHVLTTSIEDTNNIAQDTIDMVIDWIGAGIDPENSVLFIQSNVKEHAELHLLFSMLITVNRLERNPTVKEQVRDLHLEEKVTYGHLGYPVLQAADILVYRADTVPVGEDQVPHIEMTREIARRFNTVFKKEVFPEPEAKLTRFARLPGMDGKRMSKSTGNVILLTDTPDDIAKKVRSAITDPEKVRKGDPGRPAICTVFTYHQKFNEEDVPQIETDCQSGALGCVECKKRLSAQLTDTLEPFRSNRAYYLKHLDEVHDIVKDGETRARAEAQQTMEQVHSAMGIG